MAKRDRVRILAAVAALVGWAALVLQLHLFAQDLGPALGAWRFVGFFTTLSNIAVATIAGAIALGVANKWTGPRTRLVGLTAIVTVGLVYSVLLRSLWNPTGWQKVADAGLHDVTPLLFAAVWTVMPHGSLGWRDIGPALAGPAIYLGYALGRGLVDGWYPYPFIDPTRQGTASLLASIVLAMLMFGLVAASAIAIDRRLALRA